MKKTIINTLAFLALFSMIFISCEKDEPGKVDNLPEEDTTKPIVDADTVFKYDVNIPENKGYEGVIVTLDSEKLLEIFDYNSVAELSAALGSLSDGVQVGNDITFFAYNLSTGFEVESASTTNSFGHWFNKNGDVTNWEGNEDEADWSAYLFCEKTDTFSLDFRIGLYPERSAEGDTFDIVEAMRYDDYTVAFHFNITIVEAEEVEPTEPSEYPVTTLEGTVTLTASVDTVRDYSPTAFTLDTNAIVAAIGVGPANADLLGVSASTDSLYIDGFTANNGFWFNANGDVCGWGDEGAAIGAEYDAATGTVNVFQHGNPGATQPGQTYTAQLAFVNDSKRYVVVVELTTN